MQGDPWIRIARSERVLLYLIQRYVAEDAARSVRQPHVKK